MSDDWDTPAIAEAGTPDCQQLVLRDTGQVVRLTPPELVTAEEAYQNLAQARELSGKLRQYVMALEAAIVNDSRGAGAKERVFNGTTFTLEQKGEYVVQDPNLFHLELTALVKDGDLTSAEVERGIKFVPTTEVKLDNRFLNSLAEKRSERLREVINRHRQYLTAKAPIVRIKENA